MQTASESNSGRRAAPMKAATRKKAARPSAARGAGRATAVKAAAKSPTVKVKGATKTTRKSPAKKVESSIKKAKATKKTKAKTPAKTAKTARPTMPDKGKTMTPAKTAKKARPAMPDKGKTMTPAALRAAFLEIVRKTSADLPEDVARALTKAREAEAAGSNALWAMKIIDENIALARANSLPLCQDTGTIIFYIKAPRGLDEGMLCRAAEQAVIKATEVGYLRQNSVDSLTGRNSGNNLGPGSPVFHIHQWGRPGIEIRLILKGGGCENIGAQYSLPYARLGADRNLAGVEKCILDAAYQGQGKGCGPGILGVCIGGDRATGYVHSKEQLLRSLDDTNPMPELAALEERVLSKANALGIGPMGFGGASTLLGCKIGALNRLPASFFVSVSYMCWAYRRQGAELRPDGTIKNWLY